MDHRSLWQAVLGELEVTLSRANFGTWFRNTRILSNEDGNIVIAVPNIITQKRLEDKYHPEIKAALTKLNSGIRSVKYRVTDAVASTPADNPFLALESPSEPKPVSTPSPLPSSPTPIGSKTAVSLNHRYTFDAFVVGSSNDMAFAVAQAVARDPGNRYNPLFLYGGAGLGKTHLIQAVGNEIQQHHPNLRMEYVTSEGFTNEFLASLQRKKTESFTAKYRNVDVLIVDDIQFLGSKERTQEEFFHTFNALHHANKQIILSSDKPPQMIPGLEDRLKTRFAMGMLADIQPPDLETRAAILQARAAALRVMLPTEVVEFLARNFQSNIRELEGALTQLLAHTEFRKLPLDLTTAAGLLGGLSAKPHTRTLTIKSVIEKTARYFDLQPADITGPKRDREIVVPRQITMFLLRNELGLSFPKIAAAIGGRDHTTAMHSVTKIEKQLEADESIRTEVRAIKELLV